MNMAHRKQKDPKTVSKNDISTLEMVAVAAGVSPSTVSRYLNATAGVSAVKSAAIKTAIKKLNFISNPIASGLAGGKSRCVGVITQVLGSPFYGQGLLGIENVLLAANYAPLFVSSHWHDEDEMRCINFLESRRVDGIIILTACLPDSVLIEKAKQTPMVITSRNLSANQLVSLNFDDYNGAKMATQHLIDLGHKRIAFLKGTASHPDAIERLRGYRAALKENDIAYDAKLTATGDFQEGGGERATLKLLEANLPFTAIFCANDQMAYGASLALYHRGISVPGDISLVGFDDLVTSTFSLPPLTTIRHSIYETGKIAAKTIIQLIGKETPQPVTPAPELVIRNSTRMVG
jgi:LacI family transcriptional regulator